MTSAMGPEQARTVAQVNGVGVAVDQGHRWRRARYGRSGGEVYCANEPVVLTVSAPVGLTVEDAAAVLYSCNASYEDLGDDDAVRFLVAEVVIGQGCLEIEEARGCVADETLLTDWDAAYLAYCRERAAAVFIGVTRRG